VTIANGPGGIASLDATGAFRRAIDLPAPANLLVLAVPGSQPRVARADPTHVFGLVDPATVPTALAVAPDGTAVLEVWIPWSVIDPSRALDIVVAITADTGSGAGDAAPDTRTVLSTSHVAPAVLDRWISCVADADSNGVPDPGVSPRAVTVVLPDTQPVAPAGNAVIELTASPTAFAPDQGETALLTVRTSAGSFEDVSGTCLIYGMDGRSVRTLSIPASGSVGELVVSWDGRDNAGRVCDGGIYVAAVEVEFASGGNRQRASGRAGVAVVR
jgi:hypothetical protein